MRGVLRAQHTPDLPFSGWLGLAVAVDQCRRAAEEHSAPAGANGLNHGKG